MKKANKQLRLVVKSGRITAIYDDALTALFDNADVDIKRASHVEPDGKTWKVDMTDGMKFAGFKTRQEALDAERYYLDKHLQL